MLVPSADKVTVLVPKGSVTLTGFPFKTPPPSLNAPVHWKLSAPIATSGDSPSRSTTALFVSALPHSAPPTKIALILKGSPEPMISSGGSTSVPAEKLAVSSVAAMLPTSPSGNVSVPRLVEDGISMLISNVQDSPAPRSPLDRPITVLPCSLKVNSCELVPQGSVGNELAAEETAASPRVKANPKPLFQEIAVAAEFGLVFSMVTWRVATPPGSRVGFSNIVVTIGEYATINGVMTGSVVEVRDESILLVVRS